MRPLEHYSVSLNGSDHCPAMKGIETGELPHSRNLLVFRSDHCPAMKGIETCE